ncbi:MAG: hypothetical protein ABEJ04_02075 [Halobacteriaceae archaeon]
MRRRALLTALGTAPLAGCVGPLSGPASPTTATESGAVDEPGEAAVTVRVENRSDAARRVEFSLTHERTPPCRYADPPCASPARYEVVLERSLRLGSGAVGVVSEHPLPLSADVDAYAFTLDVEDGPRAETRAVEAGAGGAVPDFDAYDWYVAAGQSYAVEATVEADGLLLSAGQD